LTRRSWKKIEKTLPKEYKWEGQWSKREKKKGRAPGGIITGVKLGMEEKRQEKGEEGCMERNVHIGNEWWKIVTGNNKTDRGHNEGGQGRMHARERGLQRVNRRKRSKKLGRRGGDGKRKFKDKVENAEGKRLMEWTEENGWKVLNGNKQTDEEGEWTHVGSSGETVIDYALVNEEAWERVEKFTLRERIEIGPSPAGNNYRRNEPRRKRGRRSKGGAEESDNKSVG
jgi:hypothetical protein